MIWCKQLLLQFTGITVLGTRYFTVCPTFTQLFKYTTNIVVYLNKPNYTKKETGYINTGTQKTKY